MTVRLSRLLMIISIAAASFWLSGLPVLAAPGGATIHFTPPLATAKTIQVTEVVWEAQDGSTPGPLRQAITMTFCIERPDKFRVTLKESDLAKPATYYISDGKTAISYDGKQLRSKPAANIEQPPVPVLLLMHNIIPGPLSAVPAVRDGKHILLAVRIVASARTEYWFDPKTHLLIRDTMFITWQGKTSEVMRTDYTGWILNAPLSPAVFRAPSPGADHK